MGQFDYCVDYSADPALYKKQLRRKMRILEKKFLSVDGLAESESLRILSKLEALPLFVSAKTVLLYMALPGEVRTAEFVRKWAGQGKRIVLPRVNGKDLDLCLYDEEKLVSGYCGVLEPSDSATLVSCSEIDLAIVPGMAFARKAVASRASCAGVADGVCSASEELTSGLSRGGSFDLSIPSASGKLMSGLPIEKSLAVEIPPVGLAAELPEVDNESNGESPLDGSASGNNIIATNFQNDNSSEKVFRLGRGGGFYDRLLSRLDCPTLGICYPFRLVDSLIVDYWDKSLDYLLF